MFWMPFCLIITVASALITSASSSSSSSYSMTMTNHPPNVIVVGGSSGMGKATALATIKNGGRCMIVSREQQKLEKAKEYLGNEVPGAEKLIEIQVLDATNENNVKDFAARLQQLQEEEGISWDGLVVTAAGRAPHGPFVDLSTSDTRNMLETKFFTAYHCAKYIAPCLTDGGAVVFVAGILNRRPGINCSPLAIANGALEGLTKSLALEWGPRLRVNCLSPGFCDTERFDHMTPDRKNEMIANTIASLPLQRIGQPEDMGNAIYYLLTAPFCTGVILDVDGGHGIRQYATVVGDPMRRQQQQQQQQRSSSTTTTNQQ